jgi:hypothetical protein
MIHPPSLHLLQAARVTSVPVDVADASYATHLRAVVTQRFLHGQRTRMWEDLRVSENMRDPDGWRLIDDYLTGSQFVVLFDPEEDPDILTFPAGTLIAPLLEECPGFELYVPNREVSFLVAFNHHDYLIAAGDAIGWFQELRTRRNA